MTHVYHPNASAHALLSPECQDCCDKRLGDLDDWHLGVLLGLPTPDQGGVGDARPRAWLEHTLPPMLVGPVLGLNAMQVQSERVKGKHPRDVPANWQPPVCNICGEQHK